MKKLVSTFAVLGMIAATGASAQAPDQPSGQRVKEIVYDHAKINDDRIYKIFATPGELIRVKIVNTCPNKYDIRVRRIVPAPPPPGDIVVNCELADAEPIDIVHEERYGGYNVEMRLKPGEPQPQVVFNGQPLTLQSVVDITITVESKPWDYEMAGAFTTSRLSDPKFGIRMQKDPADTNPNATEKPFVVRDKDAEDEVRLGVAAFIHLFKPRYPRWAATFGLGINDNNRTTYFTGGSFRFGDAGALTLGYNWGSVSRLPAGTDTSRPVASDLLSKLESRVKGDVFFALSYKFLNPTGRLARPFQDVPASSGGTTPAPTSSPATPATPTPATPTPATPTPAPPTPATPPSLPASPKLLSLSASCNRVALTWEAVPGTRYRVFRGPLCTALSEIARDVPDPRFEDSFVLPGNQHYAVRSDNGIQSDLSECKSVIVPACPANQ